MTSSSGLSHFAEKSGLVICQTDWGRWHQTVAEVTIEVDLLENCRAKDVSVKIKPNELSCVVRGQVLFQGSPWDTVVEDESTWTIEDQKLLRLQLSKANPSKDRCWSALLKDHQFQPDPVTIHEMRKKLDLEQFQIENPGFDFSGAKLDKSYDEKYIKEMEQLSAKNS